jgi:hypothetical protein
VPSTMNQPANCSFLEFLSCRDDRRRKLEIRGVGVGFISDGTGVLEIF